MHRSPSATNTSCQRLGRWHCGVAAASLAAALLCVPAAIAAQAAGTRLPPETVAEALALATQAAEAVAPSGARIEAHAGALDARLRLAPCARIQAYLRNGVAAWGRTRVGLRCVQGPTAWNVSLPVTVRVWAPAVVLSAALPAGAPVDAAVLGVAEVDWSVAAQPPFTAPELLFGRVLARPLAAGEAPRAADLKTRQWFRLGETVQLLALGSGFRIRSEAQALGPGLEGQPVRVRTENGRVLVGRAVGERLVEVRL